MLPTISEDYAVEWFGSLGATAVNNTLHDTANVVSRICATTVCFWRGDNSVHSNDTSAIVTAVNFVRRLRTIAPEDFMSLYDLFSGIPTAPTQSGLRAVLYYIGGTSTTLFLPHIFAVLRDEPGQCETLVAERLFVAHFERIFSSGERQPVLLRLFLSMAQFVPVDVAFVHHVAKASIPCICNIQAFLRSGKMDPNYREVPEQYDDCLLVLACEGGYGDVADVLLQHGPVEGMLVAAILVADARGHPHIVQLLFAHFMTVQFVDNREIFLLACAYGHTGLISRFMRGSAGLHRYTWPSADCCI